MEANGEIEQGRPPRDTELKEMGGPTPGGKGGRDPPLPSSQPLLRPQTSAPHPPQPFPSSSSSTRPQALPSALRYPAPRPSGWGDISLGPPTSREPGSPFWVLQAEQGRRPGFPHGAYTAAQAGNQAVDNITH